MDPCDINHHTLPLQHGNMWNLNIPVFTAYVNQDILLYFLCDPHHPAAILHLSLASAGRSVRWPALQSFNFAFNQSLREKERELSPRCFFEGVQQSARRWIWRTDRKQTDSVSLSVHRSQLLLWCLQAASLFSPQWNTALILTSWSTCRARNMRRRHSLQKYVNGKFGLLSPTVSNFV